MDPTFVIVKSHRRKPYIKVIYVGPSEEDAREVGHDAVESEKSGQSDYHAHIQKWCDGEKLWHRWGGRWDWKEENLNKK